MRTARRLVVTVGLFLLGACATRGPLTVNCPGFSSYVERLEPSPLIQDIQADAPDLQLATAATPTSRVQASQASPLDAALQRLVRARSQAAGPSLASSATARDILLLSGGGQWGAFGAGFLEALHRERPDALPRPRLITGVSTGALQALFLALPGEGKYADLVTRYQPARESDIVDRGPLWSVAITGSIAGLKPLKRRLEEALCTRGDPAQGCPMIEQLASEQGPDVLLGFIEAASGDFLFANARRLARLIQGGGAQAARHAQQCLAGAALASAAMPVFFQQVRVDKKTYYDGGVRQSLFEAEVGRATERAVNAVVAEQLQAVSASDPQVRGLDERNRAALTGRLTEVATPTIFVLRNGPTMVVPDGEPDQSASPLVNALRAEAIVVNEVEVGSIAELRLAHPTGPIRLITADGWKRVGGCDKPKGVMFSRTFMDCLIALGRRRAAETRPWRCLHELPYAQARKGEEVDFCSATTP